MPLALNFLLIAYPENRYLEFLLPQRRPQTQTRKYGSFALPKKKQIGWIRLDHRLVRSSAEAHYILHAQREACRHYLLKRKFPFMIFGYRYRAINVRRARS